MELLLTPTEVRVLGSLVEKELTTPEYCPLTMNALILACNQKTNREPVTSYSEEEVADAVETLRTKQLAWQRSIPGSRVLKYEQNLRARFGFELRELAVMTVLMLRGPSTVGEIRGYTGRMYQFRDLTEVEESLQKLAGWETGPLVAKLPRQPGTKEHRYTHLLAGEPAVEAVPEQAGDTAEIPATQSRSLGERIADLEEKTAQISEELAAMKKAFEDFRKAFE